MSRESLSAAFHLDLAGCRGAEAWVPQALPSNLFELKGSRGELVMATAGDAVFVLGEGRVRELYYAPDAPTLVLDVGERAGELRVQLPTGVSVPLPAIYVDSRGNGDPGFDGGEMLELSGEAYGRAIDIFLAGSYIT
jgi:hypothetical protein